MTYQRRIREYAATSIFKYLYPLKKSNPTDNLDMETTKTPAVSTNCTRTTGNPGPGTPNQDDILHF